MIQLYMKHPHHGRMPVYNQAEITSNQKNGWVLEPAETVKVAPVRTAESKEDSGELEAKYEEKFGKKPHHRMKPESIEAALNEDN